MIRPKNEIQDLLFSITENCETLNTKTNRKVEEPLECKLTRPRQTFSFEPPISIEGS